MGGAFSQAWQAWQDISKRYSSRSPNPTSYISVAKSEGSDELFDIS